MIKSKQIFQVTNKSNKKMLIVAHNENEAQVLATQLKLVKKISNAVINNITEQYITPERIQKGFDIKKLNPGQLVQVCLCNISTWHTRMPQLS